jgi:hypothetical protein
MSGAMPPIAAWRIYYDDDSVASSADASWEDAPTEGVQVVMLYFAERDYRQILQGQDTYVLPGHEQTSKYGRLIDESAYATIVDRAMAEAAP